MGVYNRGTKKAPSWAIRWTDEHGARQYGSGFGHDHGLAVATLKQVEAQVEERRRARRYGFEPAAPLPIPRFAEAADAFIARRSAVGVDGKPMRRSWKADRARLDGYLRPAFDRLPLNEIDEVRVRRLIDELRAKLKPQSIRNCLAIVSRIYNEQPRRLKLENPVACLDRADREAIGPAWDPKRTPWLRTEQVRSLYLAFPPLAVGTPWRAMYAVGALAGLRTGEVRALEWGDLDPAARTLHVLRSVEGPLKDDESRIAPVPATLAAVLQEWRKVAPVGVPQIFLPTGHGGRRRADGHTYVKEHSLGAALRAALLEAKLPAMTWYQATRHTFASRYVTEGGSIYKLGAILGHSSAEVTQRYAHLQPGTFTEQERTLVDVDLRPSKVLDLAARG